MDAHEVGETIAEAHEHGEHTAGIENGFRRRAAVYVGIIGMLLAITSLGGEVAMKETINANILASDTYGFYQARNIRQTTFQIASESLEALALGDTNLPASAQAAIAARVKDYHAQIERMESDPARGNGKKELLVKAKTYEERRDEAQARDISFDFARAIFEIAIVLGSVSIVASSSGLLLLCGLLSAVATVLSVNGFFPFFTMPFH